MGGFNIFGADPSWLGDLAKGTVAATAPVAGAAAPGGLSGLFQNKLFLQLLAAGGSDLMQQTGGKNTLAALTQNIASQNMNKMLAGILKQGGDVKMSGEGLKINVPTPQTPTTTGNEITPESILGSSGGGQPATTPTPSATPATSSAQGQGYLDRLGGLLGSINPFAIDLSGVSASDLAGLSPENIMQALGQRMDVEQVNQQKIRDMVNAVYQMGLLDYYQRQTNLQEEGLPIRQFEAETERGKMEIAQSNSYREWLEALSKDTRTTFQQDYEYAKVHGFTGSPADWKVLSDDPSSWKEYQKTVDQGNKEDYRNFLLRVKKSETNIDLGPYRIAMERGRAGKELKVTDPEFAQGVYDDLKKIRKLDIRSEDAEKVLVEEGLKPPEKGASKAERAAWDALIKKAKIMLERETHLEEMEARIKQAFDKRDISYVMGRGWIDTNTNELLVRDPYAK